VRAAFAWALDRMVLTLEAVEAATEPTDAA